MPRVPYADEHAAPQDVVAPIHARQGQPQPVAPHPPAALHPPPTPPTRYWLKV